MINYQMERHKRIIQEKETQLIQSRHKNTVYGASIIVVLVITFTTGLLYIRKARMYRLIALSYYETHHDTKPISTPNQSRQAPSLRETLQKLMSEDRLYRKKDISLEELASQLNTNRTYLSEAVHNGSGMNFRSYINSLRIKDATVTLPSGNPQYLICFFRENLLFSDYLRTFEMNTDIQKPN